MVHVSVMFCAVPELGVKVVFAFVEVAKVPEMGATLHVPDPLDTAKIGNALPDQGSTVKLVK